MNWPGMGDPTKRKKTLKFLGMTAIIAISVGVGSSLIQGQMNLDNPLKVCINDRDTKYEISKTKNKMSRVSNAGIDRFSNFSVNSELCTLLDAFSKQ